MTVSALERVDITLSDVEKFEMPEGIVTGQEDSFR
jgi:hypothetical protein